MDDISHEVRRLECFQPMKGFASSLKLVGLQGIRRYQTSPAYGAVPR